MMINTPNRFMAFAIIVLAAWLSSGQHAQAAFAPIQCPHIGVDTDCGIVLTITDGGISVSQTSQGPYDGNDDTLVGVLNASSAAVHSLTLGSSNPIFAFDGDGICTVTPHPMMCPFGSTGYEGDHTRFINVSADKKTGTIEFIGGLPSGGFAYFGLEEAIETMCQPINGVVLKKQFDPPWGPMMYDHTASTIALLGCHLTCAVMVVNYYGQLQGSTLNATPETLNNWLTANDGYDETGGVDYRAVAMYAQTMGNIHFNFDGKSTVANDFVVDTYLCHGNPVVLTVVGSCHSQPCTPRPDGHAVLATAHVLVGSINTYLISDPGHMPTALNQAPYNNVYSGIRKFSSSGTNRSGVVIIAHSPIELLVTDPTGARTGFDPVTGIHVNDIPGSSYGSEAISSLDGSGTDTPEEKVLDIPDPASGHYMVEAIGSDAGAFGIEFRLRDMNGTLQHLDRTGSVEPGMVIAYDMAYSSQVGSTVTITPIVRRVRVDAMPGSCPNTVHILSHGTLSVSVVGESGVDLHDVDLRSLRLARLDGIGSSIRPVRGAFADVSTPFIGAQCGCNALGADGRSDIVMLFRKADLYTAFDLANVPDGAVLSLKVRGRSADGIPLEGVDCLVIHKP